MRFLLGSHENPSSSLYNYGRMLYVVFSCCKSGIIVVDVTHTFSLPYTSYGQRKICVSHLLGNRSSFRREKALLNHPSHFTSCKNEGRSTSM